MPVTLTDDEATVVFEILEFHRDDDDHVPYDRELYWLILEEKFAAVGSSHNDQKSATMDAFIRQGNGSAS